MSISVNWSNPYSDRRGQWLKGNLHAHTTAGSGCAEVSLEKSLELYVQAGFDFLAISDHMTVTEPQDGRLVLLAGVEWHCEAGLHTGIYAEDTDVVRPATAITDHQELLDAAAERQALVVLNHPNWQLAPHYRRETLDEKRHFDAIEIYNAVIQRLAGYAIATDKWDYLLARGKWVLGLAVDDSHTEDDIGNAWICVRAASRTPQSVLGAIRQGNFYCSSGVEITDIRRQGDVIEVKTSNAEEIQAFSDGGRRIARVEGSAISFAPGPDTPSYVRFEAFGHGSTMAWTQPFLLDGMNE